MKISTHKNEIEISGVTDFDLTKTLECGQCFRWEAHSDAVSYIGVAYGRVVRVRQNSNSIFISGNIDDFETIWRDYFDLDRDYVKIRRKLCTDNFMQQATDYGAGIRILKQDAWEALCSFIISQNNHIPRIKSIINTLCNEFGDVISFEDKNFYSFPPAARVADLSVKSLASLRCGYRAEYLLRAAKAVAEGCINLDELAAAPPETARKVLTNLHGVGDKVAACVMLFGLHFLDAFPLDVWVKRAVAKHYGLSFNPSLFSPYAGIAQQYIFHYIRSRG